MNDLSVSTEEISKPISDYTEWQRKYYDAISREELDRRIKEYAKSHPFHGDKAVII